MTHTLLRAFLLGAVLLFHTRVVSAQSPVPGTYRLFLCATACTYADSARALALATIVIADDSLAGTNEWKSAIAQLRVRVMRQSGIADNVCFGIQRLSAVMGSEELYFGIHRSGSTYWQRTDDGGYALRVYQSPDASYVLRWTGTGETLSGEGWSSGWQTTVLPHRNAFFVAQRVGPPVADACR